MDALKRDFLDQIQQGEDSAWEFKSVRIEGSKIKGPHRSSMADEMAAMANTLDSCIVLGVADDSRSVEGIPLDKLDLVEAWLREIANDAIDPPLHCLIRKFFVPDDSDGKKYLIRIDIPRSLFVHKSPNGYFMRVGSSKREMKPDALARLFQQRSQARLIRFDEQSVPGTDLSSLDKSLYQRFRSPLSAQDDQTFLEKLKLLTYYEGKTQATVAGILMATTNPESHLPHAFIQAVYYRGTERNAANQLDSKDIVGPLDQQIREACKFVERNMRVYAIKAPNRIETPQYSMNVIFEAVVNAVAHRDYSIYGEKIRIHQYEDRVELYSPGALPNSMGLDSLVERQSSRNELLSSLLAKCPMNVDARGSQRSYIMDKRGEGVPIIISQSEALSGMRPKYQIFDESLLKLTIYAAPSPHGPDD